MNKGLEILKGQKELLDKLLEKDKNFPKLEGIDPNALGVNQVSSKYKEFKDLLFDYVTKNPEYLGRMLASMSQPVKVFTFNDINVGKCSVDKVKTECPPKGCELINPQTVKLEEYLKTKGYIDEIESNKLYSAVKLELKGLPVNTGKDLLYKVFIDGRLLEEHKYFIDSFLGKTFLYVDTKYVNSRTEIILESWRNYDNLSENGKLKLFVGKLEDGKISANISNLGENYYTLEDYLVYIKEDGDYRLLTKDEILEVKMDGKELSVQVDTGLGFSDNDVIIVNRHHNFVIELTYDDLVDKSNALELFYTTKISNTEIKIPIPVDEDIEGKLNVYMNGYHLTPIVDYSVTNMGTLNSAPKLVFNMPIPEGVDIKIYINNENVKKNNVSYFKHTLKEKTKDMDTIDGNIVGVDYRESYSERGFMYLKNDFYHLDTPIPIPLTEELLVVYVDNRRVSPDNLVLHGSRILQIKGISSLNNVDVRTYIPKSDYLDSILMELSNKDKKSILDQYLDMLTREEIDKIIDDIADESGTTIIDDGRSTTLHSIKIHLNKYSVIHGDVESLEYMIYATFMDGSYKLIEDSSSKESNSEGILVTDMFDASDVTGDNEPNIFKAEYIYNGIKKTDSVEYHVLPREDSYIENPVISKVTIQPKVTYSMDYDGSNLVNQLNITYNNGTGITVPIDEPTLNKIFGKNNYNITQEYKSDKKVIELYIRYSKGNLTHIENIPVRYIIPLDLINIELIYSMFNTRYYQGKEYPLHFENNLITIEDFDISVVANYGINEEVHYSDNVTAKSTFTGKRIQRNGKIVPLTDDDFSVDEYYTKPEVISVVYTEMGKMSADVYRYVIKKGNFTSGLERGRLPLKSMKIKLEDIHLKEGKDSDYIKFTPSYKDFVDVADRNKYGNEKVNILSGFVKINGVLYPILNVDENGSYDKGATQPNTMALEHYMLKLLIKPLIKSKKSREKYGEDGKCDIEYLEILMWDQVRTDVVKPYTLNKDKSVTLTKNISNRSTLLVYNGVLTDFRIDPIPDIIELGGEEMKLTKVRFPRLNLEYLKDEDIRGMYFLRYTPYDEEGSNNFLNLEYDRGTPNPYIPGEVIFSQEVDGSIVTYNGLAHKYKAFDNNDYLKGVIHFTEKNLINDVNFANSSRPVLSIMVSFGNTGYGSRTDGRNKFIASRINGSRVEVIDRKIDSIIVTNDGDDVFALEENNIFSKEVQVYINGLHVPRESKNENGERIVNWYLSSGLDNDKKTYLRFNQEIYSDEYILHEGDSIVVIYSYLGVEV